MQHISNVIWTKPVLADGQIAKLQVCTSRKARKATQIQGRTVARPYPAHRPAAALTEARNPTNQSTPRPMIGQGKNAYPVLCLSRLHPTTSPNPPQPRPSGHAARDPIHPQATASRLVLVAPRLAPPRSVRAMASDQQIPLPVPVPVPPNPSATPTAPADPTPPASSSGARKLPIKRRSPQPTSSSPPSSGSDQQQDQDQPQTSPFKFQRIWSESDELRFLQGLLGCGAQGLVFPRDLNVFYDRFSESMPQPYTRSQLSEKLRRLKNKYRNMSARVAKGLDPARLAPHDRDVLHLCSRLWDPANAATSPFAAGAGSGASGNKRRRANPRGTQPPDVAGDDNSHDYNGNGVNFPDGSNGEDMFFIEQESGHLGDHEGPRLVADPTFSGIALEQPQTVAAVPIGNDGVANEMNGDHKLVVPSSNEHLMANAVLDVFEECLREAKANRVSNVDGRATEESELAKRWRAQRMDELHVLSRRLRLLVDDAAAAGR